MGLVRFQKIMTYLLMIVSIIILTGVRAEGTTVNKVEKIAEKCQEGVPSACQKLSRIALSEKEDGPVRKIAVAHLTDERTLKAVLQGKDSYAWYLREAALLNPNLKDQSFLLEQVKNITQDAPHSVILYSAIKNENIPQSALEYIALYSDAGDICLAAVEKLTDQNMLANVAINSVEEDNRGVIFRWDVAEAAFNKLADKSQLLRVARSAAPKSIRCQAIRMITDPVALVNFAKNSLIESIRESAVGNPHFTDQALLKDFALNDESSDVRQAAVWNITDKKILTEIVNNNANELDIRWIAVNKIHDRALLEDIQENTWSSEVEEYAKAMLKMEFPINTARCLCDESFAQEEEKPLNIKADSPVFVFWPRGYGYKFTPFLVGSGESVKTIFCMKEVESNHWVLRLLKWPSGELLFSERISGGLVKGDRIKEITIDRRTGKEIKTRHYYNYSSKDPDVDDIKRWIMDHIKH